MAASLFELTPDGVRLTPHPGQLAVWNSDKRFIFAIAGTQSGKTSFGPWWLQREIIRRGRGDYLAVTASYDLFKLKFLPEIRNVFEHVLGLARYWAGDKILELADPATGRYLAKRVDDPMWGRVILRSATAEGGLESSSAKGALLDEVGHDDFQLGAWDAVLRRIALYRGRVLGLTTPYNLGWLKQQIYDRREIDDQIQIVQFPSTLNPLFPPEEMEERRRSMPPWKFAMFYEGKFTRPAGLIYEDLILDDVENGGHLEEPFEIPTTWTKTVGVDPGAVHTAKIWMAMDPVNHIYHVYRATLEGGLSTAEHVGRATDLAKADGNVVRWCVGNKGEEQVRTDWREAGASPVFGPPFAEVEAGIDRVIKLLRQRRLFFSRDLYGLLDEFGTYTRRLDSMGMPTEEIKDRQRFHHLDALRYGVVGAVEGAFIFTEVW